MEVINKNALGVVFVVDQKDKLLGIATDGDIRRMLLSGVALTDSIEAHINKEFVFAYADDDFNSIASKIDERIKIVPVVDKEFILKDYFKVGNKVHLPISAPTLNGNEFTYLTDAFLSSWISSTGAYINRFESEFANYCGTNFGVAVSNGTVAISLAFTALKIGVGDEVIVPDLTFAATINAVMHVGATPVIVDIEEDSWCISPKAIEEAITTKTKAIVVVHLYGQVCNLDAILKIAKEHNIDIIEDCAEAHGAEYKGKKVGSFGTVSTFSFFANKIITTGEGGMCLTQDKELNQRMRMLRDHGMSREKKYWHEEVGFNYRMTNLQAAIGVAQLERIDEILQQRRAIENKYRDLFKDSEFKLTFQEDLKDRKRITWLTTALVHNDREKFIAYYTEKGIDIRKFFYPLSSMDIYKEFARKETPVTQKISKMGINLPTYNSLKLSEIEQFG